MRRGSEATHINEVNLSQRRWRNRYGCDIDACSSVGLTSGERWHMR